MPLQTRQWAVSELSRKIFARFSRIRSCITVFLGVHLISPPPARILSDYGICELLPTSMKETSSIVGSYSKEGKSR